MLKFSICSLCIGWLIIFVYVAAKPTRELSDNVNNSIKINEKTKGIVKDEENVLKQVSEYKKKMRNKEKIEDLKKSSKRRGPRSATDFFRKIGNLLRPYFRKFGIANTKGNENPSIPKEAQVEAEMKEKESNKNVTMKVRNYNEGEKPAAEMRRMIESKRSINRIGSYRIPIEEVPHMLAMIYNKTLHCGASVLNDYWALTAATCVSVSHHVTNFTLRLGSKYTSGGGILYEVEKIIIHPKFKRAQNITFNDVAVMKVYKPFEDFSGVGLVGIWLSDKAPDPGTKVMVTGWGTTLGYPIPSPVLIAADIEVIDFSICHKLLWQNVTDPLLAHHDGMLCAGKLKGMTAPCIGDSGGPLVTGYKDNRVLVGLVSFGERCGQRDHPSVYTDVAAYQNWILEQTNKC